MKLLKRGLCFFAALSGSLLGQHKGDTPPALFWESLKGSCPASLDWTSLQGKVVVVSFGADAVFPENIAEWNEIPGKFPIEPVVFLQIVSGSEFLLDLALKETAYKGCILLDRSLANRKNFKLTGLATEIVVDQKGLIAGYANGLLNETNLREVLTYQPDTGLSDNSPQRGSWTRQLPVNPLPSYEVHIARASRDELKMLVSTDATTYVARNFPLKVIIFDLWDTPTARISFPEDLDTTSYDVSAQIPTADRDLLLRLVRDAIQKHFGLRVEKEAQTRRVYLLTATQNPSAKLQPSSENDEEMSGGLDGDIFGTVQTMRDVAGGLQGVLDVPVIDETGLNGKYNYSASSKLPVPEAGFDLAGQLGLKLTSAERPVDMLVVRKAQ